MRGANGMERSDATVWVISDDHLVKSIGRRAPLGQIEMLQEYSFPALVAGILPPRGCVALLPENLLPKRHQSLWLSCSNIFLST
jgi:hypothetical protein